MYGYLIRMRCGNASFFINALDIDQVLLYDALHR